MDNYDDFEEELTEEDIRREWHETLLYAFEVTVGIISDMYDGTCPIPELKSRYTEHNITDEDVDKWIEECKLKGTMFEPEKGYLVVKDR